MMKNRIGFLCICFFFGLLFTSAQENTLDDLKVGLVLSGGGAKGLAHIGVLKIIDEAGIRIDFVGGTSMGAIIGALYVSGYTGIQIDSIFKEIDFKELLQDQLPRSAKTFYEKDDSERYVLSLPFDDFKLAVPSALSKGQNLYNLISRLTSHVSHIKDFNKLPIPFFCTATDIEKGSLVLLNKGSLPRAVTASGALPTLFNPVKIGDKLLIDGGVVNNYPVDEVRAMGADLIIGIDVQDALVKREKLKSAINILNQINNFKAVEAMQDKVRKTDLYIHPHIDDFTMISFDLGREIITSGEERARLVIDELKEIAAKQKQKRHYKVPLKSKSLSINTINIEGNKNYTRSYILGKLKLKTPITLSHDDFGKGINNLSATGNFNRINYNFKENQQGENTLNLNVEETNNKTELRLAIHFDDLYKSAILVNITHKRLFFNNDVTSFDFILGDNLRYNFEYYIDKGYYWSVGARSRFYEFDNNVDYKLFSSTFGQMADINLNKIELDYADFTNQIYLETLFKQTYALEMGIEYKRLKLFSKTIIENENKTRTLFENTDYYSIYGKLKFDTYDHKYFPKNGFLFQGDFHLYLFSDGLNKEFKEFSMSKAKLGFAFSPFDALNINIATEGGLKIGDKRTKSLDFFLGGYGFKPINNLIHFYGYESLSLTGNTYVKASLDLNFEWMEKHYISLGANIANVGDDLFTTKQWINGIDYSGYAIGYGLDSIFGPLQIKYTFSPELNTGQWFVSLGLWF